MSSRTKGGRRGWLQGAGSVVHDGYMTDRGRLVSRWCNENQSRVTESCVSCDSPWALLGLLGAGRPVVVARGVA